MDTRHGYTANSRKVHAFDEAGLALCNAREMSGATRASVTCKRCAVLEQGK